MERELENAKIKVQEDVESHRQELIDLCLKIHDNPEVGWQEEKSSGWLAGYLEKNGFKLERGICDLPTAFRASYGQGKPVVAFVAEYDAVPGTGHACGHNIIGTSAAGAGVAAKLAAEQFGGTILVMGTPAEERLGGKVIMVEKGAFDGIDAAMMVHPWYEYNWKGITATAIITLDVEFWGKIAHGAADPWNGASALQAMISAFNNINALRLHIKDKSRIAGVITDGGKVANIIPEHSAGNFFIRAAEDAYLDELREKVLNCFEAAALSTGTRLEYRWGFRCPTVRTNSTLVDLWKNNFEALGHKVDEFIETSASTDLGNVSHVVPSIHPFVDIASQKISVHSAEFAAAAASDRGMQALIDSTKSLAMTAVDVIAQPETLSRIKEEFLQTSKQV